MHVALRRHGRDSTHGTLLECEGVAAALLRKLEQALANQRPDSVDTQPTQARHVQIRWGVVTNDQR